MVHLRLFPGRKRTVRSTVTDYENRSAGLHVRKRLPDRYWLGLGCAIAGLVILGANELSRCRRAN